MAELTKEDNGSPSREIYRRGLQKRVNWLGGPKILGVHQTESVLESVCAIAAIVDPRVAAVEFQPVTFDLNTGRTYSHRSDAPTRSNGGYEPWIYTPDLRLTLVSGSALFVEAKHSHWLAKNPAFEMVLEAVRDHNHRILLVREDEFDDAFVRNLRLLRPHVDRTISAEMDANLAGALRDGPVPFGVLQEKASATQGDILTALLQGIIAGDLRHKALKKASPMRRNDGTSTDLEALPL